MTTAQEFPWGCELSAKNREYEWELGLIYEKTSQSGDANGDTSEESPADAEFAYSLLLKNAVLGVEAVKDEVNIIELESRDFALKVLKQPIVRLSLDKNEQCHIDMLLNQRPCKLRLIKGSGPVHIWGQLLVELRDDDDDENKDANFDPNNLSTDAEYISEDDFDVDDISNAVIEEVDDDDDHSDDDDDQNSNSDANYNTKDVEIKAEEMDVNDTLSAIKTSAATEVLVKIEKKRKNSTNDNGSKKAKMMEADKSNVMCKKPEDRQSKSSPVSKMLHPTKSKASASELEPTIPDVVEPETKTTVTGRKKRQGLQR